ncbi:MAG: hypothetical protein ACXAC7_22040 [Candidatus Hodarchaeales archaeon]|jgi:hypothetical protein
MDLKIIIGKGRELHIFDDLEKANIFYRNALTEKENGRCDDEIIIKIIDLTVHF